MSTSAQVPIRMKRLTLDLPAALHRAIKKNAAEEGVTMAQKLRALLIDGYATTVSLSQTRQTVADLRTLAGTWEGSVRDVLAIGDTVKITLKIKDDGSYTGSPSRGNPFTGQLSLNGGQVSFQSSRPANGTVILLEGDGKRVLRFTTTEGSTDFITVK